LKTRLESCWKNNPLLLLIIMRRDGINVKIMRRDGINVKDELNLLGKIVELHIMFKSNNRCFIKTK
jgi:hypothetical protein